MPPTAVCLFAVGLCACATVGRPTSNPEAGATSLPPCSGPAPRNASAGYFPKGTFGLTDVQPVY